MQQEYLRHEYQICVFMLRHDLDKCWYVDLEAMKHMDFNGVI